MSPADQGAKNRHSYLASRKRRPLYTTGMEVRDKSLFFVVRGSWLVVRDSSTGKAIPRACEAVPRLTPGSAAVPAAQANNRRKCTQCRAFGEERQRGLSKIKPAGRRRSQADYCSFVQPWDSLLRPGFCCSASSRPGMFSRAAAKQISPGRKPWKRLPRILKPCKGEASKARRHSSTSQSFSSPESEGLQPSPMGTLKFSNYRQKIALM